MVEKGSPRGCTGYSRSSLTLKGVRLVTSTVRFMEPSIMAAISGAAPSRCSKLSSTSRSCFSLR
jgi:hypothetical protein